MNKIRKFWKDNGTPFFFHSNFGSDYVHLSADTCLKYDKVVVDDDGLTAMDTLVDIAAIDAALQRVSDKMVISSVKDALKYCFDTVSYVVFIADKKGA